ncbi:MAG: PilN domain-containing protein [Deltaproteobacteria bacterium]|nr:PilN domain-containing protein [Deltaproteobacteria bacterium]
MVATQRASLAALSSENEALEAELAPLRALAGVDSLQDAAAALEERRDVLAALSGSRGEGSALLFAVGGAVPTATWLTDLSWDGSNVRVVANSFDTMGGADLMDGLRATGCFADVTLGSMDTPEPGGPRRFTISAQDAPETCGVTRGPALRPFTPPHDPRRGPADANRPPLLRWQPDLYRVIALVPGKEATLRDPDGRRHTLTSGGMLGNPAGKVTFITDTAVILSVDEMVDAANDLVVSRIVELPLDAED